MTCIILRHCHGNVQWLAQVKAPSTPRGLPKGRSAWLEPLDTTGGACAAPRETAEETRYIETAMAAVLLVTPKVVATSESAGRKMNVAPFGHIALSVTWGLVTPAQLGGRQR